MGGMDFVLGWKSRSWPSVHGQITQFKISDTIKNEAPSQLEAFEYTYQVSEKTFTGNKIRFGTRFEKALEKEQTGSTYTSGMTIPVFYDPENPNFSVLKPGLSFTSIWQILVGTFTISFGIFLFWAKVAFRKLFFGIFLLTVGSGPLLKGGEATLKSIAQGEMPPVTSGAAAGAGASMTFFGYRRCSRSIRELFSQFNN